MGVESPWKRASAAGCKVYEHYIRSLPLDQPTKQTVAESSLSDFVGTFDAYSFTSLEFSSRSAKGDF